MVKLGMVDPIALLTSENVQFPIGRWRCCCRPYVKVARRQLWKNSRRRPMWNPWNPWGTLETRCSLASSATCGIARKSSFSGGFYLSHQPLLQRSWNINGQIKILNRSNISPSHIHLKLLLAGVNASDICCSWRLCRLETLKKHYEVRISDCHLSLSRCRVLCILSMICVCLHYIQYILYVYDTYIYI